MVLPLIFGMLGSGLASTGALAGIGLGGLSALGAGSIGAGLGATIETGDLEKGILTGLGSFAGGALAGKVLGAGTAAGAGGLAQGTKDAITGAVGSAAGPQGGIGSLMGKGAFGDVARGGLAFAGTPTGIGSAIGGTLGGMMAGPRGNDGSDDKKNQWDSTEYSPIPRTYVSPPAGYRPGIDPEWNYGISTPQSAAAIRAYNTQATTPTADNRLRLAYTPSGLTNTMPFRMASGGLAAFMSEGGDVSDEDEGEDDDNEKDVISKAIAVIRGESTEDPRLVLAKFVAAHGEDALRDLVDKVESGAIERTAAKSEGKIDGPGDGMNDRVPARAENAQDVLLADGEYIIPADVTSHLGNGSTDAGAKVLDDMLDRVREARTGKKAQAPAIDAKKALPA
jgi:hypothetical protein